MLTDLRTASDYNRGLATPVRWGHMVWGVVRAGTRGLVRWTAADRPGAWARLALVGVALVLVLLPFDAAVAEWARQADEAVYGDADRVLRWLQEYGQAPSVLLVAVLIWRLDPARRRDLLRWLAALAICAVLLFAVKCLVGRPRPRLGESLVFLGPFGEYPLGPGLGVHHAWEFWVPALRDTSALWSMPSSHTAFAVVMTWFLRRLYPPIGALLVGLTVVVAACRVLYGAHYPSDVVAGAVLGAIAGRLVAPRSDRGSPAATGCAGS